MNRFSIEEWTSTLEKYEQMFGEESGLAFVSDIEEATGIYKECIEKGKSYEELYGKLPDDVNY